MSATYTLEVAANPAGLTLLAEEFKKLEGIIASTAKSASAAIASVGGGGSVSGLAKMRSDMEQLTAQVKNLSKENELLYVAIEQGAKKSSSTRKTEAEKAADAETKAVQQAQNEILRAWKAAEGEDRARTAKRIQNAEKAARSELDVESQVTGKILAARVALEEERKRLAQDRVQLEFKLAAAEEARERAMTEEMNTLRWKRQQENARAVEKEMADNARAVDKMIADRRRLAAAEQRQTAGLLNNTVGGGAVASNAAAAELRGMAQADSDVTQMVLNAEATAKLRAEKEALRASSGAAREAMQTERAAAQGLHDTYRGLAGGVNALWLSYGQLVPLLAGFAVAAGIKQSIQSAAEWGYQMTFVGAVARREGESMSQAMERMQGVSKATLDLMQSSLFSPKEGADGLRQLAQAGLSAEESMRTLPAVLRLATVGEETVGQAAFSTVTIMHAFGKSVEDTSQIVDELAKAAAMSTTSVSGISESMKQASTVGEMFNISLEQTLGGLTLLADRGIRGTAAGTAWRQMVQGLYAPTNAQAEALKKLGISSHDADMQLRPVGDVMRDIRVKLEQFDKPTQLYFIKALSDQRGMKAMSAVLDQLDRYGQVVDEITNKSKNFAEETTTALKTTTLGEWTQAMNSMKVAFIQAGEAVNGPLHDAVVKLKDEFRSPEFQKGVSSLLEGFIGISSFVVQHGGVIIEFVEGLLAYKAGKFLFGLAAAGVTALGSSFAGVAALLAPFAARGGVIGAALFGGYEIGSWLAKFDSVREAAISMFEPLFQAIYATERFLANRGGVPNKFAGTGFDATPRQIQTGPAYYDAEMGALQTPSRTETPQEVLVRRANWLRQKAAAEQAALVGHVNPADPWQSGESGYEAGASRGMAQGKGHFDPREQKEMEDAARAAAKAENERYRNQEAENKAHYDAQMSLLKAYHSAGLISDADFNSREQALVASSAAVEENLYNTHVQKLYEQRAKLTGNKKALAAIDAEIDKAATTMSDTRLKREAQLLQDAAKEWAHYNQQGASALDSLEKANAQTKAEITDLQTLNIHKKDSAVITAEGRIKTEEETLARLENAAALYEQSEMLTAKQAADLSEIKVIKDRLDKLRDELQQRRALLKEKKELENSWIAGAVKGMNDYLDTGLSTAKIMENGFKKAFQGMEDAIVNFVKTGKFNVHDMLASIGDDILRMMIKLNVTQPIAQWFSALLSGGGTSGIGGIVGLLGNLFGGGGGGGTGPGLFSGGSVTSGTSWLNTGSSLLSGASTLARGYGTAASVFANGVRSTLFGNPAVSGGAYVDTLGNAAGEVGAGQMTGGAAQTSGLIGSGGSAGWAGVAAWVAVAVVAALTSAHLYGQGYDTHGLSGYGVGSNPIMAPLNFVPGTKYRFLHALGFSERAAQIMSGAPIIDRIIGHSASRYDAAGFSGSINGGTATGENWQDMSQRGGWFTSDRRWTDHTPFDADQQDALNVYVNRNHRSLTDLGRLTGVDAAAATAGYHQDFHIQTTDNGKPRDPAEVQGEFEDAFATALREQTALIFDVKGDSKLAKYVRELKGHGTELANAVNELIDVMDGLDKIKLKGLDIHSMMAWQHEGESLGDAFSRVGNQWAQFKSDFTSDAEKYAAAQDDITKGFKDLGIAVPKSKKDFYDLVNGIDLSTQAGRDLWDALMKLAPGFLLVTNAADSAVARFQQTAAGLNTAYGERLGHANLVSAVDKWRGLNAGNGSFTNDQTISAVGGMIRGDQGAMTFEQALAYAQSLGGNAVDVLTDMIGAWGSWDAAVQNNTPKLVDFGSALADAAKALAEQQAAIEKWARSKVLSADSPLTPEQKFLQALDQYQNVVAAHDTANFTDTADALLSQGRDYWASGEQYSALFARVMADAQKLGGFKLNLPGDVQAASIDQMRKDLLGQMQMNYQQNEVLNSQITSLNREVQVGADATVAAILDAAQTIRQAVVDAVASTRR